MKVILLSGGVDSALLAKAHEGRRDTQCVFIDYGQPAAKEEMNASVKIAAHCGLPLTILLSSIGCSSMRTGFGEVGPRESPGRNLAMLSLVATHYPMAELLIGCIANDHRDYPDCRPEFIGGVNRVLVLCCGATVSAPLIEMDKAQVLRQLGSRLHAMCWSCYQPDDGEACGTCDSCILHHPLERTH